MLAYMRLVINPKDDEAFKRVINYPARGIGDTTQQRIGQLAEQRGGSMWEAVDALVEEAQTLGDPMQKTIARKVTEFVNLVRALQTERSAKSLYDFGLEVASRTGILAQYRQENTPEAQSAIDNIEELLNTMQLFKEQREAEIRNGEREESEQPTVEEWMQNIMLLTDMDNEEEASDEKVTLMTVHSSKGLEYKYVYIIGCEENLFPSQRAMESPDGVEEERRLFYVALTRAKCEATLSYCEMRFKWGNMEFSSPSRFLKEIDSRYVECDESLDVRPQRGADDDDDFVGRMGNFSRGTGRTTTYGSHGGYGSRGEERRGGSTAIEKLRQQFDYRFQQKREAERAGGVQRMGGVQRAGVQKPDPKLVAPIAKPRSTEGLRRVESAPAGGASLGACAYAVGERVEHPTFGAGEVVRIEAMATDHKIVVRFPSGEKTLLAKFAKLKKI